MTLTNNSTNIESGSLGLKDSKPIASVDAPNAVDDVMSGTGKSGLKINPNTNITNLSATISTDAQGLSFDVTVDAIIETTGGTEVARVNDITYGDTVLFENVNLSSGTAYWVVIEADPDSDSYTALEDIFYNDAYPETSASFDVTEGIRFDTTGVADWYVFSQIAHYEVPTSGDTLVEWDSAVPADITSYDLATYQATEDGETVTIAVEDGNGNVLYSDIGQNFDISTIATDTNVKLRANLSRTNTANNPTLDYVARRFTR